MGAKPHSPVRMIHTTQIDWLMIPTIQVDRCLLPANTVRRMVRADISQGRIVATVSCMSVSPVGGWPGFRPLVATQQLSPVSSANPAARIRTYSLRWRASVAALYPFGAKGRPPMPSNRALPGACHFFDPWKMLWPQRPWSQQKGVAAVSRESPHCLIHDSVTDSRSTSFFILRKNPSGDEQTNKRYIRISI